MYRSVLFYGFCTAINRGAPLLMLPLITNMLSIEEFGLYSILQIVISLMAPTISLNGSSAILREVSEDQKFGSYLIKRFGGISISIGLLIALILFPIPIENNKLYVLAVLIAICESLILSLSNYQRSVESEGTYLAMILAKVGGFSLFLFYCQSMNLELIEIVQGQLVVYLLISIVFHVIELPRMKKAAIQGNEKLKEVLAYTIPLLPHIISQWVISGIDRFILKYMVNDKAVGIYSLGYSLSMVLMLLNSGLALALPTIMIKNFEAWKNPKELKKYITLYSGAAAFILLVIYTIFWIDKIYFQFLNYHEIDLIYIIFIVFSGIYMLGLYYFYVNYLFYHKTTKSISTATSIVAAVNVVLTIVLIPYLGVAGAAYSTLISYIVYLILIQNKAIQIEPSIKSTRWYSFGVVGISLVLFFVISQVFEKVNL